MLLIAPFRWLIRRARRYNCPVARLFDDGRQLLTGAGRSQLLTQIGNRGRVHQITNYTEEDRYPALFELVAQIEPGPERIMSFGCSTGEEVEALRRRFHQSTIVGVEINRRSRTIASERLANDPGVRIIPHYRYEEPFDVIFALAVLQWILLYGEQRVVRKENDLSRPGLLDHPLNPCDLFCIEFILDPGGVEAEQEPV